MGLVVLLLAACVPDFDKGGSGPKRYPFAYAMEGAIDYWVEFTDRIGWLCHRNGSRWPIDSPGSERRYFGESCWYWIVDLSDPIGRVLILSTAFGASTMRRIVFRIDEGGALTRCIDVVTTSEAPGEFGPAGDWEDVNSDGVVEFVEWHSDLVDDSEGHWVGRFQREIVHKWNGSGFSPGYVRLSCCDLDSGYLEYGVDPVAAIEPLRLACGECLVKAIASEDYERSQAGIEELRRRNEALRDAYIERPDRVTPVRLRRGWRPQYALFMGWGVLLIDESGYLIHHAPGRVQGGWVKDLDGDGMDEIVYGTGGGGTGLHQVVEHVLAQTAGGYGDILCVPTEGYDVNYCGIPKYRGHNRYREADLHFHRDGLGCVVVTVEAVEAEYCECPPAMRLFRKPARPPESRTEHWHWAPGSPRFIPLD